jgi:hypothetical protein
MTRELDSPRLSAGDRSRAWAYLRDFLPGMVGYMVVLFAVLGWGGFDDDSGWRYVWVLLPVLPLLWVVRAVVRHLRRIDEYGRLLLLRGFAGGFAVAMLAALSVGFLELAGLVLPHGGAGWAIFIAGMVGWGASTGVASLG